MVNWLDLFILLFLIMALVRGVEVGFVRQFCSTGGFFVGLFLGAWIHGMIKGSVTTPNAKTVLALGVILGCALVFMTLGEYLGMLVKFGIRKAKLTNITDKFFGSLLAAATLLTIIWLSAAVFRGVPDFSWQRQIRSSRIVATLDSRLPSAPTVLAAFGNLIDPNNSPQVFKGLEPEIDTDAKLPDMEELNWAVQNSRSSVVKIEGEGCNALVEGTGFIGSHSLVVTNAHVVAGVRYPIIVDQTGRHEAYAVLFNPELDLAILRVRDTVGQPLPFANKNTPKDTPVAILGYPLGEKFTANPGVVLETFTADGRDIYNQVQTSRDVQSIKTNIQKGNSGGPVINKEGQVTAVVFAKSINYQEVAYALTPDQIIDQIKQAQGQTKEVSTSSCTE